MNIAIYNIFRGGNIKQTFMRNKLHINSSASFVLFRHADAYAFTYRSCVSNFFIIYFLSLSDDRSFMNIRSVWKCSIK